MRIAHGSSPAPTMMWFVPGRAVEEVPGFQAPLLILDDEDALAREDEEVLLHVLRVVLPVRLSRLEDVDADPVVLEAVGWLEVGPLAALLALASSAHRPG